MGMQHHEHSAWTDSRDRQQGNVAWTFSMDKQHRDMVMEHDMKQRNAALTCRKDMQNGPAWWTRSLDKQHIHATSPCRMDMLHRHEMLHARCCMPHAASLCCMFMLGDDAACLCYWAFMHVHFWCPFSILMLRFHGGRFFSLQKSANVLFVHYFSGLVEVGLLTSANANMLTTYILQFLLCILLVFCNSSK